MENAYRKALALADGELSAPEVPAFIQELARSPSLTRALQVYVAMGRRRLAKPYEARRDEQVPQWLIDTVLQAPIGHTSRRILGVSAGALLQRLRDKYRMPGWSLAAGPAAAAVLAALSAWLLVPTTSHGDTLLAAQLQRAIETTNSTRTAPLLTFQPVLTFLNKDQAYCRQFEVRSGFERSEALACRERTGTWQIVMQLPSRRLGPTPAGSGREQLERYVGSTISGGPLEPEQVDRLIERKWQPK